MRRVDRLLLRVREAERLDAMQVSVCFVEPSGDKWRAIVDLWDGVEAPNGHTQRLILEAETEEEAVAAIEEVEAAHAPTGYRAKTLGSVIIVDDLPETKQTEGGGIVSRSLPLHSGKGTFYSGRQHSRKPSRSRSISCVSAYREEAPAAARVEHFTPEKEHFTPE